MMTTTTHLDPLSFAITGLPISVLNRALELYGQPPQQGIRSARIALNLAQHKIDHHGPYTPLAQAVAEYISLSGPWSEHDGVRSGESGYTIKTV